MISNTSITIHYVDSQGVPCVTKRIPQFQPGEPVVLRSSLTEEGDSFHKAVFTVGVVTPEIAASGNISMIYEITATDGTYALGRYRANEHELASMGEYHQAKKDREEAKRLERKAVKGASMASAPVNSPG